jgi:hypothetical protein
MSYWVREVGGWLLIILGLLGFYVVYDFCDRRYIWEAALALVPSVFTFRGGIHLLKVALAARACADAQNRLYPAAPRPASFRKGPRRELP